jgi:hypothetical protein
MVGNGECNIKLTVATRVSDQAEIGPRSVPAQLWSLIRQAISPLPLIRLAVREAGFSLEFGTIGDSGINAVLYLIVRLTDGREELIGTKKSKRSAAAGNPDPGGNLLPCKHIHPRDPAYRKKYRVSISPAQLEPSELPMGCWPFLQWCWSCSGKIANAETIPARGIISA